MTDLADILTTEQEQILETKLEQIEERDFAEIAILTLPSLQEEDIAEVGYQVGKAR